MLLSMDVVSIILNAAKAAKVSGALLLAICSHESMDFRVNYAPKDKGTPSFGLCQIKKATANFLGFKGNPKDLNDPKVNAYYAAKYLSYQQSRPGDPNGGYGNDWVKLVASYNAGKYNPSDKVPGCPRNLKYLHLVQKKLPIYLQDKLNCGNLARK